MAHFVSSRFGNLSVSRPFRLPSRMPGWEGFCRGAEGLDLVASGHGSATTISAPLWCSDEDDQSCLSGSLKDALAESARWLGPAGAMLLVMWVMFVSGPG